MNLNHLACSRAARARTGGIKKIFLVGCLLPMCLLVVATVGLVGYGWYHLQGAIEEYTDATPQQIAQIEVDGIESAQLHARIKSFAADVESGAAAPELVLSQRDLNVIVNSDHRIKNHVALRIENGVIIGDISLPTDSIPGGANRFFNATGRFKVESRDGFSSLTLAEAEIKGEAIDERAMEQIRNVNLLDEARKNPEAMRILANIQQISVRGDTVVLIPKTANGESHVQTNSFADTAPALEATPVSANGGSTPPSMNSRSLPPPASSTPTAATPAPYTVPGGGKIQYNKFVK